MTVIRIKSKKSGRANQSSLEHRTSSKDSTQMLRFDREHVNQNELRGIEFDQECKTWSWVSRKKKLFAGTKDF